MSEHNIFMDHTIRQRNLVIEILKDQIKHFTLQDGTILDCGVAIKDVIEELEMNNEIDEQSKD